LAYAGKLLLNPLMTELHKLDYGSQKRRYLAPNAPLPRRIISGMRYPANEMLVAIDLDI